MLDPIAADLLDFWFLPASNPAHGTFRDEWFAKVDAFDAAIRERFGSAIEDALAGGFRDWDATPDGTLARIVLLDQLPRNAFRGSPRAFAGDALALEAAERMVETGDHLRLGSMQRMFAYLPFQHAEDVEAQRTSLALYRALASERPGFDDVLDYAVRHHDIVARFGRFPHRNAVLGRTSTADEIAFLATPGSGF